jgi:hypothetical protein
MVDLGKNGVQNKQKKYNIKCVNCPSLVSTANLCSVDTFLIFSNVFRFISENLGGYLGASVGGVTYDKLGFLKGTNIVIGMQVRGRCVLCPLGVKLSREYPQFAPPFLTVECVHPWWRMKG